jgi:hypothetical protein
LLSLDHGIHHVPKPTFESKHHNSQLPFDAIIGYTK